MFMPKCCSAKCNSHHTVQACPGGTPPPILRGRALMRPRCLSARKTSEDTQEGRRVVSFHPGRSVCCLATLEVRDQPQSAGAKGIMRTDSRSQVTDRNRYKASLCAATCESERHSSALGAAFPLSSSHASPRSVGIGLLSR